MCISIHLHFFCFPVPPGIFHLPQLSLCLLFQVLVPVFFGLRDVVVLQGDEGAVFLLKKLYDLLEVVVDVKTSKPREQQKVDAYTCQRSL